MTCLKITICILLPLCFLSPGVTANADDRDSKQVRFEKAKEDFRKGMNHYNSMRYLASVEFFRSAIARFPEYYMARDYLARAYRLSGCTDSALKELNVLHDMQPENVRILEKLNRLHLRSSVPDLEKNERELILEQTYLSREMKRFSFNDPVDIAVDSEKNMYISSFSSGKLVKIDSRGRGVFSITPAYNGKIYGIDIKEKNLALSGFSEDRIYLMDTGGDVKVTFGETGSGEGQFHGPQGIVYDDRGFIYVVDSGNNRVQKFDPDGRFILSFGSKGEYEGQLSNPTDIAWHNNRLYITDTDNNRIACFDQYGNFIENINSKELTCPRGINSSGNTLLVADEKKGLFTYNVEKSRGKWFSSWDMNKTGFVRLMSATGDRDGYLYCLDYVPRSVYIFTPVELKYSNLDVQITAVDTGKFPVVALYLTVKGSDGLPLYGLKRENFLLKENSAQITGLGVDYLRKKSTTVSFGLCVDRSLKSGGYHNDIPWLADFILKKMKKRDSLKLINFNSRVWQGQDFDWSRRRIRKALKKREYASGKAMDKGLFRTLEELVPRLDKRAAVMITDGSIDDNSFATYSPEQIISFAREHFIPVTFISLNEPHSYLKMIARETGGSIIRPAQLSSLRNIYDTVRDSEENRYILIYNTYKKSPLKGLWSDFEIQVQFRGRKGVETGGYFVP